MGQRLVAYVHDGLTFDVRDTGPLDGRVVVALHGFPQTSASWGPVTVHLDTAGVRVLAPDQRGYSPGARPRAVSAYAMPALVGDVLALADAAGVERFDLLGHDWGGAVAWALAARHPDRVCTLTVASTPHPQALLAAMPHGQALRSWYMGAFQVPGLAERVLGSSRLSAPLLGAMGTPHLEQVQAFLSDRSAARGALAWYRAPLRSSLRSLADRALTRCRPPSLAGREACPARSVVQTAARDPAVGVVRVPTTYVWSDGDPALGRWAAEHTGEWVDADYRFAVLAGVSHWVPDERPEELARLLLERLAG